MQETKKDFWGIDVTNCCKAIIEEAKEFDTEIFVDFNDVRIVANKNSHYQKLVDYYFLEMDKKKQEYLNSEEHQLKILKNQDETMELQIFLETELSRLNELNFNDLKVLIDWFCTIQAATNHSDVDYDYNYILKTFENKGFYPNMNIKDKFDENDRENFARYLIGQCLSGLEEVGSIHGIIHKFAQQWNEKFN